MTSSRVAELLSPDGAADTATQGEVVDADHVVSSCAASIPVDSGVQAARAVIATRQQRVRQRRVHPRNMPRIIGAEHLTTHRTFGRSHSLGTGFSTDADSVDGGVRPNRRNRFDDGSRPTS